jgi:hypothetical protein
MTRHHATAVAMLTGLAFLCGMAPPDQDPAKDLEKALKANNAEQIVAALDGMRDAPPNEDHVKLLLRVVPTLTARDTYQAAVQALAAAAPGKGRDEVIKTATKGRVLAQRVACVDALASVEDANAITALGEALEDREVPVRIAAIRSLSRAERRACIEPLFRRLFKIDDRSGGAEVEELFRALHHLTGQAFEALEDWEKYHQNLAADYDPKARPAGGEVTTRTRASEGKIFDSVVVSRAFVLVLDISSSMRVIDLPAGEKEKGPDGKEHAYRDPGMGAPNEASRFMRAKREFVQFIESLTPATKFSLVVYGNQARQWREELVPANEANKRAAVQFVQGLQWEAATVTDKALEEAFKIPGIDTIYLFSDGIPERQRNGKNEDIPKAEVIARAVELNLTRKLRINCYGFATASNAVKDFLRELATANDGEYKDIR